MRIRAVFTLVTTVLFPVHAQTPKTFHDPQNRFTLQVPSGWRAVALNADCIQISNGGAYLSVIVSGGDPGMAMDAIVHQFSGQWHGFSKVREGDVQLGGRAGMFATYAGVNPQGADATLKLIAMSDGGRIYLLMISATKAEFLRSKIALDQIEQSFHVNAVEDRKPPEPPAPATPPPSAAHENYYRMKKVAIIDERGFERPMQALTLLIPTAWQFQSRVEYNQNNACHPDIVHLTFRATSPDGRFAIEMFPDHHWQWSGDPQMVRMLQMSNQQAS